MDSDFVEQVLACVPKERLFLHTDRNFGGMIEGTDGSLISVSASGRCVSADGGKTWSQQEPVHEEEGLVLDEGFDHLLRLPSGGVGGFNRGQSLLSERYGLSAWFRRSDDEGKTWSKAVKIGEPCQNAVLHKEKVPIATSRGRIIAPVYTVIGKMGVARAQALFGDELVHVGAHGHENFFTYCWVYYSDDEGRNWQPNEGKGVWSAGGELFVTIDYGGGGHYRCNEPVVAEVSEDHLLMIMRTPLGRLYQSWSADDGATWSLPEPTALASSLAPAALKRIPGTGDLLIVWNQASADEIARGRQRHRLSSAISRDGGATWQHSRNVFSQAPADRTRIEPPPIRPYRAMERAPRVPPNDLTATYPAIALCGETIIVTFGCSRRGRALLDTEGKPRGRSAKVCLGLPVSWFYEGLSS